MKFNKFNRRWESVRGTPDKKVNCIGTAFHLKGLTNEDGFICPVRDSDEIERQLGKLERGSYPEKFSLVIFRSPRKNLFMHAGLVWGDDSRLKIAHRTGLNEPFEIRDLDPYLETWKNYKIEYWR